MDNSKAFPLLAALLLSLPPKPWVQGLSLILCFHFLWLSCPCVLPQCAAIRCPLHFHCFIHNITITPYIPIQTINILVTHYLPSLFVTSSSLNLWDISQFDLFKHNSQHPLPCLLLWSEPNNLLPVLLICLHPVFYFPMWGCHCSAMAVITPPLSLQHGSALCLWCWHPHAFICCSQGSLYALFHDALVHRMPCLPQLSLWHQTLFHQP